MRRPPACPSCAHVRQHSAISPQQQLKQLQLQLQLQLHLLKDHSSVIQNEMMETREDRSQSQHVTTHPTDNITTTTTTTTASWIHQIQQQLVSRGWVTFLLLFSLFFSFSSSVTTTCWAEDELSSKYSSKGFDASLVDQSCLVQHCSIQAKACLADDADCRKGLICTAKCLGNNACITGCMARYGNTHLDDFLKCTIEDHSCIQVAILQGGVDTYEQAPLAPVPTVNSFNLHTLEGPWFKVIGFNPNYDCYPCQRNTFALPTQGGDDEHAWDIWTHHDEKTKKKMKMTPIQSKLEVNVEFSMPRMVPEGTPIPLTMERETISFREIDSDTTTGDDSGSSNISPMSIGLNDYQTHEVMVFDMQDDDDEGKSHIDFKNGITLGKGTRKETSYRRTAHSEGEMFGLSTLCV